MDRSAQVETRYQQQKVAEGARVAAEERFARSRQELEAARQALTEAEESLRAVESRLLEDGAVIDASTGDLKVGPSLWWLSLLIDYVA